MTAASNPIDPVPEGYATVTPWIISRDSARLITFVEEAFGATELARVVSDDGTIGHAEVRIHDSVVMMFDARPEWPTTPAFMRLYLADGDRAYQRALDAGATAVTEMTELFWGDRVGRVRDPLGNVWWIQTRIAELAPDEIASRMGRQEFIDAMAYVEGAEIVLPNS